MAEQQSQERRPVIPVTLIRRALARPYLFMAALVLVIGAIWFARLALQEFLLLDRLVNVYTNDAQVKMATFAITPGPLGWHRLGRDALLQDVADGGVTLTRRLVAHRLSLAGLAARRRQLSVSI